MKKQLEVGKTYPTRDGEWTGIVLCDDLNGIYPCCIKLTNIETGKKIIYTYTLDGRLDVTCGNNRDLIIPEPEPKWRPWKVEEIPVGSRVRRKDNRVYETLILKNSAAIAGDEPYLIFLDGRSSASAAFNDLEYWDGTSWQPCGVLE